MKRLILLIMSAMLLMGGAIMTGCHDDKEDLIVGNDPTKIVFNKNGEPEYDPIRGTTEDFLESHIGKVARLAFFHNIPSDGKAEAPHILYGISDPLLYFKDKETLIIFNLNEKTVNQSVEMKVSYDLETCKIRSDGKYVAQLRRTMASPSQFGIGIFYYGEQKGKNTYVNLSLDLLIEKDYFIGLDEL